MQLVNGDMMVSSSNSGFAFCVWDLKTGIMLKKHDECLVGPNSFLDELPDGCDMTSMVYLPDLNAFCGACGGPIICSFPIDGTMKKKIASFTI